MRTLTIGRIEQTDVATFGLFRDEENRHLASTLELPDRGNEADESCIPVGSYTARRFPSPKRGYDVFMLVDVPGRSDIELHIGNTVADTHGCVLLGSNFGVVNGQNGITGSQSAFAKFMSAMDGVDEFRLVIVDATTQAAA